MPKQDDFPIMILESFKVTHVGSNIAGVNVSAIPTKYATTNQTEMEDQMVVDLGTAVNDNNSTENTDINKITAEFTTIVNEHPNITDGSAISVACGVIGKPKMVWINQLELKGYVSASPKPILGFQMSIENET